MLAPGLLEGVDAEEDRDPAVAISAAISTDLRPIAPTKTGISLRSGWKLSFSALPSPSGQRQLVVLALVVERALAGDDLAHDLDVLAGAAPGLRVGHAVPALGDLRARRAEAEDEAAAGELVDRRPGHRRGGGRAGGHLHDRGAELDRLGLRGQPGEHADHVGAVGLGHPDRFEAGLSAAQHDLEGLLAARTDAPVAEVESELQRHPRAPY